MSDPPELNDEKKQLRREIRVWLAQLSPNEVARRSERVFEAIRTRLATTGIQRVAAFVAMPAEPDLSGLWSLGLTMAFPKVSGDGLTLWSVPDRGSLRPGYRGIPEPDEQQCERIDAGALGVILVPGLAFGALNGLRLGRGGGFYDRLLNGMPGLLRWGVCFDEQVRETIPGGGRDARMDALITCQRELIVEGGR